MQTLINRDVFVRDPSTARLLNDGVAKVLEPDSPEQWEVLRYELQSFVCEGEYARGLERILSNFVANLAHPQQPAVWVSGFYGSGKSHFVRVLEQIWRDRQFPDGARARDLVDLPSDIKALLIELSRLGKQEGGLWTAAGKLSAGDRPVKLDLLATVFRAAGLPEAYPAARFVLWLRTQGWLDPVRAAIKKRGKSLDVELRNMYVSPFIADALLDVAPGLGAKSADVHALLRQQYPNATGLTDDEFRSTLSDVLSQHSSAADKLPLTLLVFDELQQAIGDSPAKALEVQEVVELTAAEFGSRVLFVGTGQNELEGSPQLSKLKDRFPQGGQVHFSDRDVETVVREVVLRKKEDKKAALRGVLDQATGEIDRHLAGTRIGPRPEDATDRVADYPLLPTRVRFWERVLRQVDRAGSAAQLRTQLRVVHDATAEIATQPVGRVLPADALYWQLEADMQQTDALQREMALMIRELGGGTSDRLESRLGAMIWLVTQLPTQGPLVAGLRPSADILADLLVEDLRTDSAPLRQQVQETLDMLADSALLMRMGDEYRLQTRESTEWEREYDRRRTQILADKPRVASERDAELRNQVNQALRPASVLQGNSKVKREPAAHFGTQAPPAGSDRVPVWIRDEWSVSERVVREDAQAAGTDSPVVFVFVPKLEADEIEQTIARMASARDTVASRPMPESDPGKQARTGMDSRAQLEGQRLTAFISNIVKGARVYLGGGNEITGDDFTSRLREAVDAAATRLFPRFSLADETGWERVVRRAADGAGDPLSALKWAGDVEKHPACQEVRGFVGGAGKRGLDVQKHFMGPPYGWPKDAVDGALLALLAGGFLRASRGGQSFQARGATQSQLGPVDFASEGVTVSALQRIAIKNIAQQVGLQLGNNEEVAAAPRILERLRSLAERAGGDPPLPSRPDTVAVAELEKLAGNDQAVKVADDRDQLQAWAKGWSATAETIEARLPNWERLQTLLAHAASLAGSAEPRVQAEAIRANRSLLDNPDPVPPLISAVAGTLRQAVTDAHQRLVATRNQAITGLDQSAEWGKLSSDNRDALISKHGLLPIPALDVDADDALVDALNRTSLAEWENRIAALPTRAGAALQEAVRMLEPGVVPFHPPSTTLKTAEDVEDYVERLRAELLKQVATNPVLIS